MTHIIQQTEFENRASLDCAFVVIDITALDREGEEDFDPSETLGISGAVRFGIDVRGQTDNDYRITYDPFLGGLAVQNVADGTDVAENTEVGSVMLEVVGV